MSKYAKEFPFTKEEVVGKIKLDINSYNIETYFIKEIVKYISNEHSELPLDFIKNYVVENTYLKIERLYNFISIFILRGTVYCKFNNQTYMTPLYSFYDDEVLIIFIKDKNGKWSKEFISPKEIVIKKDLLLNKIFKIKYQARRK